MKKIFFDENGPKPQKFGKSFTTVLIYPNTYYIGMSSIGFQHIYSQINRHPDFYADRAFLSEKSPIRSYETGLPLKNFNILFFSISYELDYLNFVRILMESGIPLKADKRSSNCPVVIVGGACTFFNPEPIAEFTDVFIIGEGEETLQKLLDTYAQNTSDDRNNILQSFKNIDGVYLPSFYSFTYDKPSSFPVKIKRQHINNLALFPAHSHYIASNTEFKNMLLFEISRGCAMQCKFCMVKSVYGPIRHQDKKIVTGIARTYRVYTDKIGLVAPTVTNYPQLKELCGELMDMQYKISFSSLRLEHLDASIIEILIKSGQKTITLAPEAGSEKLRRMIGKNISSEKILQTVEMAVKCGSLSIKLYFMIGLPEETWEDIENMVNFIDDIKKIYISTSAKKGKIGKLIISVNPFIPKPFTEFQTCGFEDINSLNKKYKYLKKTIRPFSNVELNLESLNLSYWNALLARGDRRMGELLIRCANGESLSKAMIDAKFDDEFVYRKREKGEVLPWEIID
ncbi:radical SAM protein [Candidatus Desantisbacteria bacterium]|nr:radical SAM protein [Candidatus Desantisbacteria bacterium]